METFYMSINEWEWVVKDWVDYCQKKKGINMLMKSPENHYVITSNLPLWWTRKRHAFSCPWHEYFLTHYRFWVASPRTQTTHWSQHEITNSWHEAWYLQRPEAFSNMHLPLYLSFPSRASVGIESPPLKFTQYVYLMTWSLIFAKPLSTLQQAFFLIFCFICRAVVRTKRPLLKSVQCWYHSAWSFIPENSKKTL